MVDVDTFVRDGFVKIERAAPRAVADDAREMLWQQLGLSPDHPASWTQPVVWATDLTGTGPFGEIVRSPRLGGALDQICGDGAWIPRGALGNIPVRFPVASTVDDRGWHIDLNTPLPDGSWAVSGRPHTLLLLTVLSEVTVDDAPTRVRAGSHRDTAAILGETPLDAVEAGALVDAASASRPVHHATGVPGDMYIVHPFTVHAAGERRGATPRFMAQAPVMLRTPLTPTSKSPLAAAFR
ncbi:mitomycin antibiotics/polyketide fumonisin biosynthesis protein [Mycobacterium sp. ITM-2017-0098]|nr:mitomycin antibiotics/polyketide fumonisin biosynthesis protein [Mycobacterium sp. ITM-2017-0098]